MSQEQEQRPNYVFIINCNITEAPFPVPVLGKREPYPQNWGEEKKKRRSVQTNLLKLSLFSFSFLHICPSHFLMIHLPFPFVLSQFTYQITCLLQKIFKDTNDVHSCLHDVLLLVKMAEKLSGLSTSLGLHFLYRNMSVYMKNITIKYMMFLPLSNFSFH